MIQPGSRGWRFGWQLPALVGAALVGALAAALVPPLAYLALAIAALILVAAFMTDAAAVRGAALALCAAIIIYPALLPRRSADYVAVASGGDFGTRAQVQLIFVAGIAAGAGALWLTTPGSLAALGRGTMGLLGLYIVLAAASLAYTPDRAWAGFALLKLGEAVAVLAVLAALVRTRAQLRHLMNIVLAACAIILLAYWPDILGGYATGWEPRARNAWIHPNSASLIAYTFAAMLAARAISDPSARGMWRAALVAMLGAVTGLLAAGKSALGAGLLALAITAVVAVARRSPRAAGRALALSLALLLAGGALFAANIGIARHLQIYTSSPYDKGSTLTGRVPLWEVALARGAERPILGHGYMSTFADRLDNGMYWQSAQAHNVFIQSYVDLGLIGAALVALIYLRAWGGALSQTLGGRVGGADWRLSLELLAGLTVLTVVSLTENVFGGLFEIGTMLFLVIIFAIDRNGRLSGAGRDG